MNYRQIAVNNYKKFAVVDGNEYIASEFAIKTILKLIEDFKVKTILEVGLGIGSISDTIFKYDKQNGNRIQYTGTEANDFCLNALKENVDDYDKIRLFSSMSVIKGDPKYDFIIVDGSDESLQNIANFCKSETILFIEGFRGSQVNLIKEIFPDSVHAEIISSHKNPDYGPFPSNKWAGGGQLIFINPTAFKKWYWFAEKAKSFLKRRLRKLK